MTETFIELTEDEFDDQFPLVPNHINPSAGWAVGDSGGCLFETFGEEFAFVRRHDPRKVWTLVDGDDGDMYVISGCHFVNRIGYLISRDSVPDNATIQVHLPMQTDEDEQ
ncbi:hypothetical protein GC176_26915 [bacterium]|nr:hypothetical protein [bacterium]